MLQNQNNELKAIKKVLYNWDGQQYIGRRRLYIHAKIKISSFSIEVITRLMERKTKFQPTKISKKKSLERSNDLGFQPY